MLVVSRVAGIRRECPIRRAVPVYSSGRQHAGPSHCMQPLLTLYYLPHDFSLMKKLCFALKSIGQLRHYDCVFWNQES